MAKENKESTTSVGVVSPLTDYADGITAFYLAPHFGRSYPVRKDGDIISAILSGDAFDGSGDGGDDDVNDPKLTDDPEKPRPFRKAPTLMDIELISQEIVYDAALNPTVKVTFKIRNSSGEPVKAVNALVEKK